MVVRALELDQYMRSVLAPLGFLFPFPVFCRKLDSCVRQRLIAGAMALNGGGGRERGGVAIIDFVPAPISGRPLPNDQF